MLYEVITIVDIALHRQFFITVQSESTKQINSPFDLLAPKFLTAPTFTSGKLYSLISLYLDTTSAEPSIV